MPIRRLVSTFLILVTSISLWAAEMPEISVDQASALAEASLRIHLNQQTISLDMARRIVKGFLRRLDEFGIIYLQDEVDKITSISPESLADITFGILHSDMQFFSDWVTTFKANLLPRDQEFIDNLKTQKAEIMRKVTRSEIDAIKFGSYPKTKEERRERIMLLLRSSYEAYRSYMSEDDALNLSLQAFARILEKKSKINEDTTPKEVMKAFMLALDPHSEYMDAEETEEFRNSMERNFFGIGVQIRTCLAGVQIVEVYKNMPAGKSGEIEADDQIIAVDGVVVAGQTVNQIVKRIKGAKGTKVKITVRKVKKDGNGEPKVIHVTLVRDTVDQADVKVVSNVVETANGRIGYVSVENFYDGMANDVKIRIMQMSKDKPLDGLVLDLRNNGGGLLGEAIGLVGLFITSGPVLAERDNRHVTDWDNDNDISVTYGGPLVVLINQGSASASEIAAGSLKDYGRAVIVGPTQSYGKGTVQRVMNLGAAGLPGSVRITIKQYFLPSGESVQLKGVLPDITIPGAKLREDWLEKANDGAIQWDKVDPGLTPNQSDFAKYMALKNKCLGKLSEASSKRVAEDRAFDVYRNDQPEDTSVEQRIKPKDKVDPQMDEAVRIAADMVKMWKELNK